MSVIKSQQIDWTSSYGDLVKRTYWISILQKRVFNLEFRAIPTGTEDSEDQVPPPHFYGIVKRGGQSSRSQSDDSRVSAVDKHDDSTFHFVVMITLSSLIRRADGIIRSHEPNTGENEVLQQGSDTQTLVDTSAYLPCPEGYNGLPSNLALELFYHLDCWFEALPQRLQ
jgi:hypothetical protein